MAVVQFYTPLNKPGLDGKRLPNHRMEVPGIPVVSNGQKWTIDGFRYQVCDVSYALRFFNDEAYVVLDVELVEAQHD